MDDLLRVYPETAREAGAIPRALPSHLESPEARAILDAYAGATFAQGIYRVHHEASGRAADQRVAEAFPWLAGRVCCLSFDWLGQEYLLDASRRDGEEPLLLLADPGFMEVFYVPYTAGSLHASVLPLPDGGLLPEVFGRWAGQHPESVPLPFDECVGLVIPPFLGGTGVVENLARTPIDVYWDLHSQLAGMTRALPDGTPITGVTIGDASNED